MPTRSPLDVRHGAQVPRVRHAPSVRANAWEDIVDLAKAYGLVLDPWQENVLAAAMGERADGQWAASTVGVNVPRQNGKGALIEARELAGLLLFGEQTIIHSAHEQKTARIGFQRLLSYFENYDDLRKKVRSVMSAVNRENIKLRSGAEIHFPARSKGAIRGFSIDCLILDEAQILGDPAWEAIKPTISARPNVQTWLLGTTPTPLDDSAVFARARARGHEAKDHRLCWCEWSAPLGSDLDDRDVWALANPALGIRITEEAIADERAEMSPEGFGRERLSIWPDETADQSAIDIAEWAALQNKKAPAPKRAALAVDVSPDRRFSTVAVAGAGTGDKTLVMVKHGTGMDWVVAEVVKLIEKHDIVGTVLHPGGQAGALIPDLVASGVAFTAITTTELGQACARFQTDVKQARLQHLGQAPLDAAVANARTRMTSEAERWDRREPGIDISSLVAASEAAYHWAAVGSVPEVEPWEAWT